MVAPHSDAESFLVLRGIDFDLDPDSDLDRERDDQRIVKSANPG